MGNRISVNIKKPSHDEVWKKSHPDISFHRCPLCRENYMDRFIHTKTKTHGCWRRGYKISPSNGGSININNLIPICWDCRYRSKGEDLKDFSERMGYYMYRPST